MKRKLVHSSQLQSVGYDIPTQTLEIEFKNGSVYQYFKVPLHIHETLMNHASKGAFFTAHIKSGQYRYQKVN